MNSLVEIKKLNSIKLDKKKLSYYTSYFKEYYQDRFRINQGTEVILNVLKKFGQSGLWLDIGAGPATLFWSLMLGGIKEIHCSEINIEGLKVLNDFIKSDLVPGCYIDVIDMFGVSRSHLELMRNLPRKYFLFDALNAWPKDLKKLNYDIITSFGVFGLSKTEEEYKNNFGYMKPFLKIDGIAIGANWIRSKNFINQNNMDNRYLKSDLIGQAAKEYGYGILHLSRETIENDPNYDAVVVWVLRKK